VWLLLEGERHGVNDHSQGVADTQAEAFPLRISIISDVRFLRESLAEVLPSTSMLSVSSLFADARDAIKFLASNQPDIVLLDAALPNGLAAVGEIRGVAWQLPVVVIAVAETAEEVIAWAEAGAAGYIPRTAGVADIVPLLVSIRRGEQPCPASVASGMLRRISNAGAPNGEHKALTSSMALTARETQIAQMIVGGMSNKDIARRLSIELATAKTHVHNILRKLNLQRRGQTANWMRSQRDRYSEL
jgi:DNA-binding NarL/FixJ family response regulator